MSGQHGIGFKDFLMLMAQQNTQRTHEDELKEVFRFLDDNQDGLIEIPKLRLVIKGLASNQVDKYQLSREMIVYSLPLAVHM